MATLVLSVAGTVLGGPVGGAIGAMIGQQIDGMLLKGPTREGPRLSDLRVQTSTYGSVVPAVWGRLRVAGTVVWATDLVERRARTGGSKTRPATSVSTYTVSLAVAVSSRPIRGIGRIWADGRLLRGPTGAMAARCTVRVATGDADQPVDPRIAAEEGAGQASAHRGLALVILEDLELESFGNRVPMLSFEVIADGPGGQAADKTGGDPSAALPWIGPGGDAGSGPDGLGPQGPQWPEWPRPEGPAPAPASDTGVAIAAIVAATFGQPVRAADDGAGAPAMLGGLAVGGGDPVDALAPLIAAMPLRRCGTGRAGALAEGLALGDRGAAVRVIDEADWRRATGWRPGERGVGNGPGSGLGDGIERRRDGLDAVPGTIAVGHHDPARDDLAGRQTVAVAGAAAGAPEQRIDLSASLSAAAARALAGSAARRVMGARMRARVRTGLAAIDWPIGAVSRCPGSDGAGAAGGDAGAGPAGGWWRLTGRTVDGDGVVTDWVSLAQPGDSDEGVDGQDAGGGGAGGGGGGRAVLSRDPAMLAPRLVIIDLPALVDGSGTRTAPGADAGPRGGGDPIITGGWALVGASPSAGWPGLDVWRQARTGAVPEPVGRLGPATMLGVLEAPARAGAAWRIDAATVLIVRPERDDMPIEPVTIRAMLAGANTAMLGREAVRFAHAEPITEGQHAGCWRVSGLLRGVGGTEDRIAAHPAGTPFVVLAPGEALALAGGAAVAPGTAGLTGGAIGDAPADAVRLGRISVAGPGDKVPAALPAKAGQPGAAARSRGGRLMAPVGIRMAVAPDGALRVDWTRRSRGGAVWRDHLDAPPGAMDEAYVVVLRAGGGGAARVVRRTRAPSVRLTRAAWAALGPGATIAVAQLGDGGAGVASRRRLPPPPREA